MPRLAALKALEALDRRGARLRESLDSSLKEGSCHQKDRDFARHLTYGAVRHRGAVDALLQSRSKRPLRKLDLVVLEALRLGAYQIVYLDRVPARAAVHTTVELVKASRHRHAAGFANAVLRAVIKLVGEVTDDPGDPRASLPRGDGTFVALTQPVLPDPGKDLAGHLAARWSHPRWIVERFLAEHGEESTLQILDAGLRRPLLSLRPAAGRVEALRDSLTALELPVSPEGNCLLVEGGGAPQALRGWDEFLFSVQGPTAASVVPSLAPPEGAAVLELCAAPGGKTVGLAEAVGPKGLVLAVDRSNARLSMLAAEVGRRSLAQVAVLEADGTDPDSLPKGVKGRPPGFDAALVDVPCSNTGVLGRRVEVRWSLKGPDQIDVLAEQAGRLLVVAAGRLRPGGRLAYSTCSIDAVENQSVVQTFLAAHPSFRLESETLTLPHTDRRDGGYHAILLAADLPA